ncbi:unnamed protein product [Schistocephalus solidus]|uniref:CRIB domain-containing protein n=2 Tax=Schistocephalus solidus TaxID=70667 RepID=A0A183SE65_SCHSO|nr:unnamed protein product [Schistocephalus solidus]
MLRAVDFTLSPPHNPTIIRAVQLSDAGVGAAAGDLVYANYVHDLAPKHKHLDFIQQGDLAQLTTYQISIASKNFLYRSTAFSEPLLASTTVYVETAPNEQAMRDEARQAGSATSYVGHSITGANVLQGRSAGGHSTNMTIIIIVAACFGCLIFITNLIIVGLVIHRRQQRRNSKLKRIPGTESLVKCGVIDTYPTADCYPERFANGQHVLTAYMDSGSQKDSLSQYQFEHFGQCSPNLAAEYLTSGPFFHPQSPLNLFTTSSALTSGGTLPENPMQTMQRFNSLSQSSSPLHSSRSHGIQPDPSGMGLTQIPPNYGYAEQQPQSIYLVAAPNPGMTPMRYPQEGSDDMNPMALYLNSDNLGMTNQTMPLNVTGQRGLPMCGSNQGTVSPHSMTDKSVNSDRGGLLCSDQMQRVASYVNQVGCFPITQSNGATCARSFVAPGPISSRLQNQQACQPSSPRLVSSFYAQRNEVNPAQSTLGPHSGFGRRNSCATHEQDGRSPLPGDKMDKKARPMVTFASEEMEINDFTMSSDITTIPPPTDFGVQTTQVQDTQYPTMNHASMSCNKPKTGLIHQASGSFEKPVEPEAWRPGTGCLSARLPSQRISRASILPNGQSTFSRDPEKTGVHFDISMLLRVIQLIIIHIVVPVLSKMLKSRFSTPNQGIAFFACCMSNASSDHKSKIDHLSISAPTDFRHLAHIGCTDLQTNMTSSALIDTFSSPTSTAPMVHLKLIDLSEAIASHHRQASRPGAADSSASLDFTATDGNGMATTTHHQPTARPPSSPPAKPPRCTSASDAPLSSNRRHQHRRLNFGNAPLPPPPPPPPVLVGK